MKPQELTVLCHYSKGEAGVLQIIQCSFETFLKKNFKMFQNTDIPAYNTYDKWPLISGGMICI